MAIKKTIEIDVNTKAGLKAVDELGLSFIDALTEADTLTGQIGELEDALYAMAAAGDTSSKEYTELAQQIGVMKKVIIETDMELDAMSTTMGQKMGGAIGGVSAGFELGIGSMAAFGVESEGVEKALLKVQSAMAISQGIQGIREAIPSFKALGSVITKTAIGQRALNVAQAAGAVGMRILNAVMNLNPVFLIVTGITALVGAIVYFTGETEKAAEMNQKLNDTYNETIELSNKIVEKTRKRVKHEGEMLAAQGASEKELHENRLKQLKVEEIAREANLQIEAAAIKDRRDALNQARKEGNDDLVAEIEGELQANQAKYDALVAQNGDYYNKLEVENAKFQKSQELARQQELAAEKAAYDKRVGEWKAFQNRRLAVQREIENARIGAMFEGQQKELATLEAQAKNRREDILADTTITEEEKEALIRAYEDQRQIARADIRAKYVEQERQAERDAAAARAEIANIPPPIPEFEQIEEVDLVEQEEIKLGLLDEIKTKWRSKEYQDNLEHLKGMEEQSQNYFAAVQQGLSAMSDLNDLLTDQAVKKAKGNAQAEEAARKKGFERGKKIQLVSAVITGIQGVMAAFTAGASMGPAGVVMGPLMAGLAAVTAGVNIAKIASQKYEGGGGGGGGAAPRAPSVPSQPSFNAVGAGGANQLAESLGSQNEQAPVKAYVVGADVTSQQSLDRNKTENASI